MTGVVLKLLKATAPVSRSTRVNVVGWIATTCTCAIWSCGMVNSSALSELLGLFESAGAADLEPSQPANTKRIANAPTSAGSHRRRACIFMSNLTIVHSRQFPHDAFPHENIPSQLFPRDMFLMAHASWQVPCSFGFFFFFFCSRCFFFSPSCVCL